MSGGYHMLSREYFDQVRTSVADLRRAEEMVDYWESKIAGSGASLTASTGGIADPDRMTGRIAALWDAREKASRDVDALVAAQDEAVLVIRQVGDPQRAATALWRDVLLDRYVMAMTFSEISEKRGRSVSSVRRALDDALDWIDGGPGIDALVSQATKAA